MSRQAPSPGPASRPTLGRPPSTVGRPGAPSAREHLRILVLAALLAGSAAAETIPIAVIASVIGWLVATVLQQRETRHQPSRAPAS
jgi:hypothetical protein